MNISLKKLDSLFSYSDVKTLHSPFLWDIFFSYLTSGLSTVSNSSLSQFYRVFKSYLALVLLNLNIARVMKLSASISTENSIRKLEKNEKS